jgi:ribonuclease HI
MPRGSEPVIHASSDAPSVGPVPLNKSERAALRTLAGQLHLGEYDLLLVGDGSGGDYQGPAGWACVAYDRELKAGIIHAGAVTSGTVNYAELFPYLHALWYHSQEHRGQNTGSPWQVVVVSDSEVTVRCGNGEYGRHANVAWWRALEWYTDNGYALRWHHIRRLTNEWNVVADAIAGAAREQALALRQAARSVRNKARQDRS